MEYVGGDRPQPESTRMGYSLSWIAVKGKPPQAVRDEFSFRMTDGREEIPESDIFVAAGVFLATLLRQMHH